MDTNLNKIQFNILIASIIGDGEINKIYPKSRRKNNSYKEHYGTDQVRSASLPLFTQLFPYLYSNKIKKLPLELLEDCSLPHFLAILYMDYGSLSKSHRINPIF